MSENTITKDMMVAEVLEQVPGSEDIFANHGVNPREECGTAIYTMDLRHAERDCGIDDLDALINDLEEKLEESNS